MSDNMVHRMTSAEFAALAEYCGLSDVYAGADVLCGHGILPALVQPDNFHGIYLSLLYAYRQQVRVCVAPWGADMASVGEISLAAVREQAQHLERIMSAIEAHRLPPAQEYAAFQGWLEKLLPRVHGLGKLAPVCDLVSQDVVESMSGDVRLYVELAHAFRAIQSYVFELEQRSSRSTQDMEAVSVELLNSESPTRPQIKTPELSTSTRAESLSQPAASSPRVTAEMPAIEKKKASPPELPSGVVEAPKKEDAPTTQELEEEPVELEVKKTNPFARDPSQSTSNTQDLQRRLEALRHLDGRGTPAVAPATSSLAQKAIALSKEKQVSEAVVDQELDLPDMPEEETSEPWLAQESEEMSFDLSQDAPLVLDDDEMEDFFEDESQTMVINGDELRAQSLADSSEPPEELLVVEDVDDVDSLDSLDDADDVDEAEWQRQIEELNAKREAYMKDQNWSGLVELYEDGVELFEAEGRRQVYLTLAKLYELKLKDTARALESMALAFELGGEDAVLRKIIEALQRLGKGPARSALMAWVDAQLSSGQWSFQITDALQRMRAGLLQEAGDAQRGFLMYASFVADSPDLAATDSGLDFLEGLAKGVDATELYELYDELIEQNLDHTLAYHLNSRAGFFALQREDFEPAIRYLEKALELDPAQDQLFHVLAQLYEEDQKLGALIVLHERRARAVTGATKDALLETLSSLRGKEATQREACRAYYAERLERSPQDDVLLECIMRSFLEEEHYIDGYAFLNRHLDKLSAVASRVRALQTLSTLALQNLSAPEEALVHLEEALELGGARKVLLERLIMINLDLEDWDKVLHYIERLTGELVAEMSDEEHVRWLLAGVQAAQSMDKVGKEKDFLERALRVMPDHEQAKQALQELS